MQTVPSLIGTGTAIATAATGLIFGQLDEGQLLPSPSIRPSSSKRKAAPETERDRSAFSSRPGTTDSTAVVANSFDQYSLVQQQQQPPAANHLRMLRRSSQAQITPPTSGWRFSNGKQVDLGPKPIAEDARDSVSSNGSWMRRLSIRPLSQHESVRSSCGPDSQSMFSHGSAAPILSPNSLTTPQLPPNKLVKRSSTRNGIDQGPMIRRGSKPQLPTLRRPATSHQRSATLHKLTVEAIQPDNKFSFEQQPIRPRAHTLAAANHQPVVAVPSVEEATWKSFFHAKIARIASKTSKKGDTSAPSGAKRICLDQKGYERAYLITPRSIMPVPVDDQVYYASVEPDTSVEVEPSEESPQSSNKTGSSASATPSKTPRRSISLNFSSPTTWISKTGSIRRRKRGAGTDATPTSKRYASDPLSSKPKGDANFAHSLENTGAKETLRQGYGTSKVETDLTAIFQPPNGNRSLSSPLPPLSRLSSFHIDLNRLGSSESQARLDETAATSLATNSSRVNSNVSAARTLDRASTVASSEYHRGFMSGDDDDTDFRTDTPYDSLRTVGSGRRRTLDSPLESMFDESPPSTAGNTKQPKRLSIQEILGPAFDGDSKIMEEDEGLSTPVRRPYDPAEAHFRLTKLEDGKDFQYPPTTSNLSIASRDFGRLSLEDDDDLDWTKDDEDGVYNHLSPPGSMNSRRGSPNHRPALTIISGNGAPDSLYDSASERPRSNIFDWAESTHEMHEGDGQSYRPKTVHGKRELDMRGGRAASRRTPIPAHIRSQSVPVVQQDPANRSKPVPKFGTWGLGSKNVSEDWDEDFEFEEEPKGVRLEGKKAENRLSMVVPAFIAAKQPTVKAHSGQIRELSLLVNDLKRLCRLGRELDMISGPFLKLWRDADGIIALASPDDDIPEDEPGTTSDETDSTLSEDRFVDEGFDGCVLEDPEHMVKANVQLRTAVVRDRPIARRRSVFSPEDDIFGSWPQTIVETPAEPPRTPERNRPGTPYNPASVARSLVESMHLRRREPTDVDYEDGDVTGRLNFDTNSLKELVKRAGDLRDSLSDLVRRADHITSSPMRTPRRDRGRKDDGSPAFTRVFDDPTPTRPVPQNRSSNTALNSSPMTASPSNGISQRMQMMTVS